MSPADGDSGPKGFWEAIAGRAPGAVADHDAALDGERLQKVLARAGIGSRRVCEDLIAARRVRVGSWLSSRTRPHVHPETDEIEVDHVRVAAAPGLVHYLLNKPRGVVTTASDPQGRRTVVELVPDDPRVFPVGRLDVDTEACCSSPTTENWHNG